MLIQPFEVSYTTIGRNHKKERNVIGVLCPTVLAQRLWRCKPIFISLGDITVDWNMPVSAGFRTLSELNPNLF